MKEQITYEDYLKLVGLRVLADRLDEERDRIEASVASIIEEPRSKYGMYDDAGEFMFGGRTVDNWLHWLKIKVTH